MQCGLTDCLAVPRGCSCTLEASPGAHASNASNASSASVLIVRLATATVALLVPIRFALREPWREPPPSAGKIKTCPGPARLQYLERKEREGSLRKARPGPGSGVVEGGGRQPSRRAVR